MAGFFEGVRNFFTADDDEYYDDAYDDVDATEEETEQAKPSFFGRKSSGNVVNMNPQAFMTIVMNEPMEYDDSTAMVDDLKAGKSIIVNLNNLDQETRERIFYFLTGAIYCLSGNFHKVSTNIFVLTPNNVEVEGVKEALKQKHFFL